MSDLGCGEVVHTWNTDVMMIKCVSLVLVGGRSFWHPASAVIVHRARALTAWLLLPGLNILPRVTRRSHSSVPGRAGHERSQLHHWSSVCGLPCFEILGIQLPLCGIVVRRESSC